MNKLKINKIRFYKNRQLRNTMPIPDFVALMQSIQKIGLMHPITVTKQNYLVDGYFRYWAAIAAGLDEIPVKRLGE